MGIMRPSASRIVWIASHSAEMASGLRPTPQSHACATRFPIGSLRQRIDNLGMQRRHTDKAPKPSSWTPTTPYAHRVAQNRPPKPGKRPATKTPYTSTSSTNGPTVKAPETTSIHRLVASSRAAARGAAATCAMVGAPNFGKSPFSMCQLQRQINYLQSVHASRDTAPTYLSINGQNQQPQQKSGYIDQDGCRNKTTKVTAP